MNPQGREVLIGALAAIVVDVAAVGVAIGVAGLQPPGGMASPDGLTSPLTSEGPDARAEVRYSCSADHASFTGADLRTAPAADASDDTASELLEIVTGEGWLPVAGWRRVVDSPQEVVFLSDVGLEGAPYAVVHVVPGDAGAFHHGGWAVDSYGACTPRPEVPEDVSVAEWWVDPGAAPLGPESESIQALILEQACASGQSAEGRILPPMIVYGTHEVTVTVTVQMIEGEAACPGNPFTPFTILLDEPIGDRTLLDGGQVPLGDPLEAPQN